MQDNFRSLASASFNELRLAGSHGYRFQGDLAFLNAELVAAPVRDESAHRAQHWALQLWACESPHQGGALRGIKVAQAELSKVKLTQSSPNENAYLEVETFANLPAQGDYAMVLVLAAGEGEQYDQVHDFSNYAERQQFEGPRLEGSSGYRFDNDGVLLQAERVRNTRDEDNLSGSLALELWALSEPYQGGDLRGTLLASAPIGRLWGNSEERDIERYARLNQAPVGQWRLALVLTEWTHRGHVARDFSNFALPYQVPQLEAHALTSAVEATKGAASSELAGATPSASSTGSTTTLRSRADESRAASAPEASSAPKLASVPSATSKDGSAAQLAAAASKSASAAPVPQAASKDGTTPKLVAVANKDAAPAAELASKEAAAQKPAPVADKDASAVAAGATAASKDASKDAAAATSKDAAAATSKDEAAATSKAATPAPAAAASKEAAATPAAAKVSTPLGKDTTPAKPGAATTHGPS